ncbi:MAG: PAS domain-containing sensor histidine kinase [Tenuifilaceae bacterium]
MIRSTIQINIIIRVILITISSIVLAYAWVIIKDPIIDINLVVLIGVQLFLLIKKINRINDDLALFFDSIKFDDTGLKIFQKIKLKQYHNLYAKLDDLANHIIIEKEKFVKQNHYLQTITEHSGAGLISFNQKGTILIYNKAAKDIIGIKSIANITDIDSLSSNLSSILKELQPGEQKVVKMLDKRSNRVMNLLIIATEFKSGTGTEKLISFSDIRNELDEKELDAWQKMISILTHEMMNSIGPLTSTIATLRYILSNELGVKKVSELSDEMIIDIYSGLRIIDERTIGLQGFVKGFRSLTKLPQPEFAIVKVRDLFNSIGELMTCDIEKAGISISFLLDKDDATIYADKKLIEQVLINLIKNSIDALSSVAQPKIQLIFSEDEFNQPQIVVKDNGAGISIGQLDEIFVPFFTTKKEGTGIGLSLSRQIMRLHGGTLSTQSKPMIETSFYLKF